jgi:hypothetical protein
VPSSEAKTPSQEYTDRQQVRERTAAGLEAIHIRLGYLRLLLAIIALAISWFAFKKHMLSGLWLLLPLAVFLAVAVYHAAVLRRQAMALRAAQLYQQGLARIEDRWAGTNPRELRADRSHSLYASDLDLFGEASLFELLCTTRTRMGEDVLAGWLLAPEVLGEIRQRQAAVQELRERLDLREAIATLGKDSNQVALHPQPLLQWAETESHRAAPWLRVFTATLAVCASAAAAYWLSKGTLYPLVTVVLVEWCLYFPLRKRVHLAIGGTESALADMQLVAALLARLETESFESPRLRELQAELVSHHIKSSKAIAALARLVGWIESLHNPFMRLFDLPLMFSVQLSFAVRSWRTEHGKSVRRWLQALGEMEALLSLATYHYEHRADPFPEFVEAPGCFLAEALGHPLIPAATCVRNDIRIGGETKLLLISGSNMSGKSTLMRSIGINTVLAMCGAPVRAERLQLTPCHVAASILVSDSLHEGSSRFYAEIKRLRAICGLAEEHPPVLFLLDELLQGTNSKDRLVGARGIAHALIASGAIGVITTHDLSLTELEQPDASADLGLRNMHLEDRIEDGKMKFDYTLRDGVVTRSNGIELMRLVGLKV